MTAGGDGFAAVVGGPALHIPVLGRPAVEFLNVHDGGVYIDATFGAGGYTRAILAAANCKVIGIDRDPSAIALGRRLVQAANGRLTLIEDRFCQSRRGGARGRLRRGRRRGARSRRLLHAARYGRARIFLPPRRAARHAHGRRGPERGRCRQRGERARSRQYHFHSRRGAALACGRARHRQGPRASADPHHARRSPISSPRWCVRARAISIRRRARSRRCASSSTTSWANWSTRLHAAERILKPQGRLVAVSFHSLEDRIVKIVSRRPRRNARRLAPRARAQAAGADLPRAHQAPGRRRCGRGRAQSARPLGQAARRRAQPSAARARRSVRSAAAAAGARRRSEGALSMRLLNIFVIGALILAASFVYKIKFDSTLQAERVAKLAGELRRERDAIASLRAEWAKLDTPGRIQGLAARHLALRPIVPDAIRQPRPAARAPARWCRRAAIRSAPCSRRPRPTPPAACRRSGDPHERTRRKSPETRWQRWLRSFLYGRDVDRNVKAKARLGLAIVAFAAIYGVIALRLVMFAEQSDGHGARRSVGAGRARHRASRYPRPQRADPRHRREGAVAVRRTAQAHRRGRGGGTADRGAARSRRHRSARAPVVEARLRLAQARDHAEAAAGDPPARHSRRRLPDREQARLSQRRRWSRTRSGT